MLNSAVKLRGDSRILFYCQKRFKKVSKVTNADRALEYFDTALSPVYRTRWPSIRLALLSPQKYVSIVNNFAGHEDTIEKFHDLGAVDIRHTYSHIVERMRVNREERKKASGMEQDVQQSATLDQNDQAGTKPLRPSLIELDDDELAARAKVEPKSLYPEEYRLRALAQNHDPGSLDMDHSSRVILPSEAVPGGATIMQDHMPATRLKGLENWVEETDVFLGSSQGDQEIGLKREVQEEPLTLPSMLKIFSFSKGDITKFPHPRMDHQLKVLDHYPLDGASLLPVLALDLQGGERLLDLCAAPGGKTLLALQTMLPGMVVSNDATEGRVRRLSTVLGQYLPATLSSIQDTSLVTQMDGRGMRERDAYDKILVDVPCLTDRHVLQESDNSIFSPSRAKERLKLPELQSQLLVSALQMVRPGGAVVYSTCTLSPLQNDGVVHLALSKIWEETNIECCVVDLSYAVRPLSFLYRLGTNLGLRYGQIVLPSLLSNFGPMYCAKIKRLR